MAKAIALKFAHAPQQALTAVDALRFAIVSSCALALIAAGQALPAIV
jgi:hypothetical protein